MNDKLLRLKEYLDLKGKSNREAEIELKAGNGRLGKMFKSDTALKPSFVEKILSVYTDINPVWFETGKGDMLKVPFYEETQVDYTNGFESEKGKIRSNAKIISDDPINIEIPLISVSSRASFNYDVFHDSSIFHETGIVYKTRVKGLKRPVLIDIDGDSMAPQLNSGTRVLADEIDSSDWNYITGVVAVSFKNQFVVKRIKDNHSIETNTLMLYSDNEKGGSFSVKLEDIKAIWKVIEIVKSKVE